MENRPRYTPTTIFETFPFPEGLSPNVPAAECPDEPRTTAIAEAARRLVELRDRWLTPPEWVEWVDEPVSEFPKRAVSRSEAAEKELRKRTLTNLYNARPQWLDDAHVALDAAVAAAYGWSADMPKEDALQALLELNRARSTKFNSLTEVGRIGPAKRAATSGVEFTVGPQNTSRSGVCSRVRFANGGWLGNGSWQNTRPSNGPITRSTRGGVVRKCRPLATTPLCQHD